jgi:hypothetical protein
MTDFVYSDGTIVTYADGTVVTAGHSTTAHVETNDRVFIPPIKTLSAGVKPNYPVEIDTENPLAKGLVSCVISSHDLAQSDIVVDSGVSISAGVFDYDDSETARILLTTPTTLPEFTIFTLVKYRNSTQDHGMFGADTTDFQLWADTNSSELRLALYNGTIAYSGDGTLPANEWVSISAYMNDATDKGDGFVNGIKEIDNANIGTTGFSSYTDWEYGRTNTNSKTSDAEYAVFYLWDRKLSNAEHKSLHKDPYQFLKSPVPQTQIITTAPTADDRVWVI